ncbi:MAG: outer membrane protein assembly factor BamD [Flavobacteriales bacterium]
MNKFFLFSFAFLALLLFTTGCSEYNKALKSDDYKVKYEAAVKYYNNDECFKALPLLEECIGLTRGTAMAEDVYYYYAKTHYCVKDYYLASYYLKNFAKTFSKSPRAEECFFQSAYCNYRLSPEFTLDQTDTRRAIDEFQLFLDTYPTSALRDSANKMIGELNAKLELKDFENAKLYHTTQNYKGAVNSLKSFITNYPSSIYKENAYALIVESYYLYAEGSIEEKKLERYRLASESYITFATAFPQSKLLKEAEVFYEKSRKQIEKLSASN